MIDFDIILAIIVMGIIFIPLIIIAIKYDRQLVEREKSRLGKVRYRTARGTLSEALKEYKEFPDEDSMKEYVCDDINIFVDGLVMDNQELKKITKDNIYFKYSGYDERINWDTYYVLTNRIGNQEGEFVVGYADLGKKM